MKKVTILIVALIMVTYNAGYAQDWEFLERMQERANAQYEGGLQKVSDDYHYLRDLKLINKYNSARLEEYQVKVLKWMQTSGAESLDYSNPINVSNTCSVINGYLIDKPIKDEIDLLNSLYSELRNLKSRNPENFTVSPRYKELMGVIDELRNCSNNDIKSLALKHSLFY